MKNRAVYFVVLVLLAFSYAYLISCSASGGGSASATLSALLISPSSVTVNYNSTQQFSALGLYSDNSVKSISPGTWEVIGTCGTIDADGLFYAGSSSGSGEIIATYEAVSGTATVTVGAVASSELASITISPSSYSGRVGESCTFTGTGKNSSGETISMTPEWSVVGSVGAITSSGVFTATAEGTGLVKCASGEVSTTAPVTISGYSVIITAEADTYVDSDNPTAEYSTSDTLNVSYANATTHIQDAYISFDVSSIPVTATVSSATLSIYVVSADLKSFVLKKISNSWTPTMTYTSRPSTGAYTYISSLDQPTQSSYNSVSVTETVAGWVATPSTNKGIYLNKLTDGDGGMSFLSTEGSYRPYLIITYN